jgi:hypothetical protein
MQTSWKKTFQVIIIRNVFSMGCSVHPNARPHRSSDAKPEWYTLYLFLFCWERNNAMLGIEEISRIVLNILWYRSWQTVSWWWPGWWSLAIAAIGIVKDLIVARVVFTFRDFWGIVSGSLGLVNDPIDCHYDVILQKVSNQSWQLMSNNLGVTVIKLTLG